MVLKLFGIKEKQSRQAWREKVTLCWIAVILGGIVGFATMGLQRALCPNGDTAAVYERLGKDNCKRIIPAFLSLAIRLGMEGGY